jgi:hypothetical protein
MIKSSNILLSVNGTALTLVNPSIGFGNLGETFAVNGLGTSVEIVDSSTQEISIGDSIKVNVNLDGMDYTYTATVYSVDDLSDGRWRLRLL